MSSHPPEILNESFGGGAEHWDCLKKKKKKSFSDEYNVDQVETKSKIIPESEEGREEKKTEHVI